jgi:Predicted membrane protein
MKRTTSKHARSTVRIAGILLGILIFIGAVVVGRLPFVVQIFNTPHWPSASTLGTMWTFLSIVSLAGLGLVIVFAIGGFIEQKGLVALTQADKWIVKGRHRASVILALLMLMNILIYSSFTFYRHYYFNSTGWDLAIQDQVVWNTSHGRLFESSIEVRNYLGDHFQPYMAIVSLFYLMISSPYVLLAVQSFVLASVAWPLYILARRKFDSPTVGLVFVFCVLAYTPIGYINRYDFHIEVVVIPLLVAAFERTDAKKFKAASAFMGLALLGKEEIGLTVAVLGLMSALYYKRWWFGLTWTVVGVVYALVALLVIIPEFRGAQSDTLGFYRWLGETPAEMIKTIVLRPGFVVESIIKSRGITTFLQLIGPLAFLPLLSLHSLALIIPAFSYNFLSSNTYQATIYCQYMSVVISFVLVSAVMGLYRLTSTPFGKWLLGWILPEQRYSRHGLGLGLTIMILAVLASWFYQNPFKDDGKAFTPVFLKQSNEVSIRQGIARIPDDVYLVTTNQYAPHLSQRRGLTIIMEGKSSDPEAEAFFLNQRDLRGWYTCEQYRRYLEFAADNGFGITFYQDGVVLVQKDEGDYALLRELLDNWSGCE